MNLFKLKKDGKCVGYCEWTENWGWKYYNDLNPESKFTHFMVAQTGLTAHPFVTTDKNGKNVFAEDKCKWQPPGLDELCEGEMSEELDAVVKGGFLVFDVEGTDFVEASEFKDIELIENPND